MNKSELLSCFNPEVVEAGCDEAGRGCLAGPVFAAAVILPDNYKNPLLNDSKKLSAKQRNHLRQCIEKEAVACSVARVDNHEIDEINILNASFLAMSKAVAALKIKPGHLLIDGNRFKTNLEIPFTCMVKGDGRFLSIAAASVLAKTYRDDYMNTLDQQYPDYEWQRNKGYPTRRHREAIRKCGITKYHRKTFRLLDVQLNLNF